MKSIFLLFLPILLFSLLSCSKDDPADPQEVELKAAKKMFAKKYPTAQLKTIKLSGSESQCDFIDENTNEATCWFVDKAWELTQTQYDAIDRLPSAVRNGFLSTKFGSAEVIYIDKIERNTITDPYYRVKVNLRDGGIIVPGGYDLTQTYEIYLLTDGTVIDTTFSTTQQRFLIKILPGDRDFIAKKYGTSDILACYNSSARSYFIRHDKKIKRVDLINDPNVPLWLGTFYALDKDEHLPANVLEYMKRKYPDYTIQGYYWKELNDEKMYVIWISNGQKSFAPHVDPDIDPVTADYSES